MSRMRSTGPAPHPLPPPLVELVAERFQALAEPTRIRLLDHLRDGAATVGELSEAVGGSQQNVSKHLGILRAAGLVAREREGNFARYRISDPTTFQLCDLVCGRLRDELDEMDRVVAGSAR
jgi:DNA-binding transcriptional ArsR family regulator